MQEEKILVINPGSTSTKIAVFKEERLEFQKTLRHSSEELSNFNKISDQYEFRKDIIIDSLKNNNIKIEDLKVVVGRGGLLKPIKGGTYEVNEKMLEDLKVGVSGEHASNLGGIIASEIAKLSGGKAFIVDPVVVDELQDIARISGLKEIERRSIFHALNQKAVARRYCKSIDKGYEEVNLIIAHLGGGISVGAHQKGRVIDVANALDGEGPFSPERSGELPVGDLINLCFSGKYTLDEMKRKITGQGGMVSYLNSNDMMEIADRINNGDEYAKLIFTAMAYQVSKEIGSAAAVLKGKVDAIILTGGIAYSEAFNDLIKERVSFIGELIVYPGEDELLALAEGGLRVVNGEEVGKIYK